MHWVYLAAAILAEVIATSAMKLTDGFTRIGPSAVTIAGYAIAFFLLSLTLDRIPMGIAYAIWSGAGIVLISTAGWLFYRQALDAPALVGMGLIVAGVLILNLFSRATPH